MTVLRATTVAVLLAIPSGAGAQSNTPPAPRGYALGIAGYGSLSDDEGGLGSGAVAGGAAGWFITDRLALEVTVTRTRHERQGSLSWTGRPVMALARLLYVFGDRDARARFFVAGGFGYFRYPGTFTETIFDSPTAAPRLVARDWLVSGSAVHAAAGVEIGLGRWIVVRPEAGLTIAQPGRTRPAPEPPYTLPQLAIGAGVRF